MKQIDTAGPSSPLIHTKVRIPHTPHLLSRPRLLDWLHDNIHRPVLLVCAGPGYGKTSLLVDFARDAQMAVCWYTVDPSDQDPRTFLDYLVEAVRVRFPGFGEQTRALLAQDRGGMGDLPSIIGVLVNEFVAQIPEFVVIVLDDYHVVEAEEGINRTLDTLLQYLPEHVHIVILSRSVPPLSLTRLAAYGKMAAIGTDPLRFTVEEASALLQRHHKSPLGEEQLRQLVEECEGWVTAILLRTQAGRQEAMRLLPLSRVQPDHVYAYLADEVLADLAPDMQHFLKQAAIPRQLDSAFADALLQRSDSARILRDLERRNLFLIALGEGWYRFHDLFREFLLGEMRKDPAAFSRLHRRAAALWQERGEAAEAIEHLLLAGAMEEAGAQMESLVQELYLQSRFRILVRWLEALPPEVRRQSPRLLLYLGRAYIATGQGDKARTCYQQAEAGFAQQGNPLGQRQTLADLAVLERLQGRYQPALQVARAALAGEPAAGDPAVVDLHRTIAVCLLAQGDPEGAITHARAAVAASPGTGSYNQALAYLDLGYCLDSQGHLAEAHAVDEQALAYSQKIGSPDLLANILNNLASRPYLHGDWPQALELLERAEAAAQTSLSAYLQALVQASLGDLYGHMGDPASARQRYQQGLEFARAVPNTALVSYILDALGNQARREAAFPEARSWLEQALAAAGGSAHDCAHVGVSFALLEAAEGHNDQAMARLDAATARQEKAGWQLEALRAWIARAIVEHGRGNLAAARQALEQAAALAAPEQVIEPFLAEHSTLRPLLRTVAAQSKNTFLHTIEERLPIRPPGRPVAAAAPEQSPALRILALGPGHVFRNGHEIVPREWGYRVPRELFFYLALHYPTPREQVGLALWPERSAARISSAFHAALYRARRTVGCQFVTFQEDIYTWNEEVSRWCDVDEFERLLDQVAQLPVMAPQSIDLLEQAVTLYRGDFLADFDRPWCDQRREDLRGRYLWALLSLGERYTPLDPRRARQWFQDVLQVDSFCEEAYRGLMRCYMLVGERAAAAHVYQRCREHLARELQIEPSAETVALYDSLLQENG